MVFLEEISGGRGQSCTWARSRQGITSWQRIAGTSRIYKALHLYLELSQILILSSHNSNWRQTDGLGDASRDAPFF